MPKHKNGPNAFYYFMVDWKQQEELKGVTFPRGLNDVQADRKCNEAWKNLPAEIKKEYKEKEKNQKIQLKVNKKTCLGESVEEVEKSELSDAIFMDEMKRSISTIIVRSARSGCVEKLKFHVVHINYLYSRICDNNEIEYYPAEIGIAEFSLEKGITRTYHKIVNSKVKMGYASAALEHSKNTHQIPRNFGESDYSVIYEEIFKFLESSRCDGKLPPLYTLYNKEDIKFSVVFGLELFANSCKDHRENLMVYSFEELFVQLHNINIKDDVTEFDEVLVSIKLTEDPYDYRKNLACEFHQNSGGENFCSKSIVQRWIFILCSFTCSLLNIDLLPGFHIPIENINTEDVVELNYSFEKMNLSRNKLYNKKEPKHPSERTWADEQKRRSEAMLNPIQIAYNNSEIDSATQNVTVLQKPLHPPFTKPATPYSEDCSEIMSNEYDFPSIGRGSLIRSRRGNVTRNWRPQNRE